MCLRQFKNCFSLYRLPFRKFFIILGKGVQETSEVPKFAPNVEQRIFLPRETSQLSVLHPTNIIRAQSVKHCRHWRGLFLSLSALTEADEEQNPEN